MGLFERAGRQFERFKQKAESAAEETADYECNACGARTHTPKEQCPTCGADGIAPVETAREVDEAPENDRE